MNRTLQRADDSTEARAYMPAAFGMERCFLHDHVMSRRQLCTVGGLQMTLTM